MKKFIGVLLIFCIIISTFSFITYADQYNISPFSDIPNPEVSKK